MEGMIRRAYISVSRETRFIRMKVNLSSCIYVGIQQLHCQAHTRARVVFLRRCGVLIRCDWRARLLGHSHEHSTASYQTLEVVLINQHWMKLLIASSAEAVRATLGGAVHARGGPA